MPDLSHQTERHGLSFRGTLRWSEEGIDPGKIAEDVHLVGGEADVLVYATGFDERLLSSADRTGYLRVMTSSIVDAYFNPNIKKDLHVRAELTRKAPAPAAESYEP